MAAVCRKPIKKTALNGFALFRRQIMLDLRQQKQWTNDEEVTALADEKWQIMTPEEKEEWRNKGKREKVRERNQRVEAAITAANSRSRNGDDDAGGDDDEFPDTIDGTASDSPDGNPPAHIFHRPPPSMNGDANAGGATRQPVASPHLSTKRFEQATESTLKKLDDLELASNPEKRRDKVRATFYRTFTWKYEKEKELLKDQNFYILTAQLLCYDSQANYVPAEIACTEFNIRNGVQDIYCVPVKPPGEFEARREEIDEIAAETHGFTFDALSRKGVPCQEVVRRIFQMCKNREPNCGCIRFFTLASMYEQIYSALGFLLDRSDLDGRHKEFSCNELACLDDLTHGLWKFYDVDCWAIPRPPDSRPFSYDSKIDLSQILQSLDVYRDRYDFPARSLDCAAHHAVRVSGQFVCAGSPGACARCGHFLLAEIIASSINAGRLDNEYLRKFVAAAKAAVYCDVSGLLTDADDGHAIDDVIGSEYNGGGVVSDVDDEVRAYNGGGGASGLTTPFVADDATSAPPAAHTRQPLAMVSPTECIQTLLPVGSRGLGRGLHLSSVAELSILGGLREAALH